MVVTSFWGPDGKPISAAEFFQRLFGDLPAFSAAEDERHRLWSVPDTRKALLDRLAEHGYGTALLAEVQEVIEAEASDLYDVLAHVAFARRPVTREASTTASRDHIAAAYDDRLRAFLDFVLGHDVDRGVAELDPAKLPDLLTLRYGGINDARAELGDMARIRQGFIGFQRHLYDA